MILFSRIIETWPNRILASMIRVEHQLVCLLTKTLFYIDFKNIFTLYLHRDSIRNSSVALITTATVDV